jgi:hypothetical protein
MAPDPGHRLGQLGDRVVRLQHGSVSRCPARGQPYPGDALLGGLDQVEPAPADRGAEPADLADRLRHALEQLGVVVHQPARAPLPARLLVGEEREHHVARRASALPQPLPDHREHHRVHVLHVHGAAAPDASVSDLAGERVHTPVRRIRGDHVEMTVDQQAGPTRVLALDPDHDTGALRMGLEHGGHQAHLAEQLRYTLGRRALPRAGVITGVRRVDPDQFAGESGDLILRGRAAGVAGRCVFRHPAMVAPRPVPSSPALHPSPRHSVPGCPSRHPDRRRGTQDRPAVPE